jgi:hypothetical protein
VGYTTVTLKQKKVQFPSPTFLQASPNTLLHVGITDWCLSFCDGCKWAMYMAFQFEILHLENLGRDLPGEWMCADLGIQMTDEACAKLRKENKRKMEEDTCRVKKERQNAKTKKANHDKSPADKNESPLFDYGQLLINDTIKVDLFKEMINEFRTPKRPTGGSDFSEISCSEKVKAYMHVSNSTDYPEEARNKARTKLMQMLDLVD